MFLILLSLSCISDFPADKFDDFIENPSADFDGDGQTELEGDCDDTEPAAYLGADEICDGVDNDCNEEIDETTAIDAKTWYPDIDGDNWGQTAAYVVACEKPENFVETPGDCDDQSAAVHPGAQEVCSDGIDEDCNGLADDEDPNAVGVATWFLDADRDSYGGDGNTREQCERPEGYVLDGGDCNDLDPSINPGATERCDTVDNDCDTLIDDADEGVIPDQIWTEDADGDGFGSDAGDAPTLTQCTPPQGFAAPTGDCDDGDDSIHPMAAETCDLIDNDCNQLVDDGVQTTFYLDADGDGFGQLASMDACELPAGYATNFTDCDDTRAESNPAALEYCNGEDDDCDYQVDENDAEDAGIWHPDADGDGYGNADLPFVSCEAPPTYVLDATDCDDARDEVNPAGTETCATTSDDDCDGSTNDEDAIGCTNFNFDSDGDGYGISDSLCLCVPENEYSATQAGDCDDSLIAVHPGQVEDCATALDDNCDGETNENGLGCSYYYYDYDGDGYGLSAEGICLCTPEGAHTAVLDEDCDDLDIAVNPGGLELCFDAVDNDCSGDADGPDSDDATLWHLDGDGDGYGVVSISQLACDQPAGYVDEVGDCDDGKPNVNPGQVEDCATVYDDDCDANSNNDDALNCLDYWLDADADNHGDASDTRCLCFAEGQHTSINDTDCDDSKAYVSPSGIETCDTPDDEDCDGDFDEDNAENCLTFYYDFDGDGYGITDYVCSCLSYDYYTASDLGDCEDADSFVNPGELNCGLMGDIDADQAVATIDSTSSFMGGFDYNQDGNDDLLVGNTGYATNVNNTGGAFLFFGPVIGEKDITSPLDADLVFAPTIPILAGSEVSAGDFDGDGQVELLIASGWDTTYVIDDGLAGQGTIDDTHPGVSSYNFFNSNEKAFSIGDVNDDGFGDAIIGTGPYGKIAYGGSAGFTLSGFGVGSKDSGDINGDGIADLVVSKEIGSQTYRPRIYWGGAGSNGGIDTANYIQISNTNHTTNFLGDVTGDGLGDVGISTSGYDYYDPNIGVTNDVGVAYMFSGDALSGQNPPVDETGADWILYGAQAGFQLGTDFEGIGDIDADGVGDVGISGNGSSNRPLFFYGPLSTDGTAFTSSNADAKFLDWHNHWTQSSAFSPGGDINGDGYDDILLGRPKYPSTNLHLFLGAGN